MKKILNKEVEWIKTELSKINPLFHQMWLHFEPMVFDENAESAELELWNNNFRLVANPTFWKKCNRNKKLFVICHEMCHVMFGHWLINPNLNREWCNIAQDIQVNEFLLKEYFDEKKIRGDEFVTLNYVFKDKVNFVKKDQGYLYYYDILMKCAS
jgi:predicted metal-dependent peptidase